MIERKVEECRLPGVLPSSGYCLVVARPSVSTTSKERPDINLLEEGEEEVEQHSWGHLSGRVSGGDCIAAISSCQSVNLLNILQLFYSYIDYYYH